ncbi:MAG: response regulator [Anaeromyxobacteraceae bacterium]
MSTVLVVDDEPTIAETLCMVLEMDGYRCVTASDGLQALERLPDVSPSLVLLDVMMPVMDGREFLRRLRADARWRDLPVIVMTAAPRLAGNDALPPHQGFFQKPFDLDRLLAEIGRFTSPARE